MAKSSQEFSGEKNNLFKNGSGLTRYPYVNFDSYI